MPDADAFREHHFLSRLRRRPSTERLLIGIGDDAALHRPRCEGAQLLAIDTVVEGTHARSGPDCHVELARKVVRSNVSDIAAMGGIPDAALLSLKLPRRARADLADAIMDVVFEECARFDIALVGGDTVVGDGGLVLTLALSGHPIAAAVSRGGARPGDLILVTGTLGGSILGKHHEFLPRLAEARLLVDLGPPSAMTDVSDGFLRDLGNIAALSCCGAIVDARAIPVDPAAHLAAVDGRSALEHALSDGEDFELLLTLPPERLEVLRAGWNSPTTLTVVGRIVAGADLILEDERGKRTVEPMGYEHGES